MNGRSYLQLFALWTAIIPAVAESDGSLTDARCQENLGLIFEAIDAYVLEKNVYPTTLAELVPSFVADPNVLLCPTALHLGDNSHGYDEFIDASDGVSTYAFELAEIPFTVYEDNSITLRDFKAAQRQALGDMVPLVRCFRHAEVINLSFSGMSFESSPYWELDFVNQRALPYMQSPLVFRYPNPLLTYIDPPYTQDQRCIDMASSYNALLGDLWLGSNAPCPLADFSPRVLQSDGVVFEARAATQLHGGGGVPSYPIQATVQVNRSCRFVHFLHACASGGVKGAVVAEYTFRFGGSRPEKKHPIRYGTEIGGPTETVNSIPSDCRVAWQDSEGTSRLYHLRLPNPFPSLPIAEISLSSKEETTAPFIIAITTSDE